MEQGIKTEIAHCDTCKELTPQSHMTCGSHCQVCYTQNNYSISRVFSIPTDKWLADFWELKYHQLKINQGTIFTIQANGK